jgi:uncharacterized phage protein (TIGR02220 family)
MKWYKMYVNSINDIKFKKLRKQGNALFAYYWTAWCIILDAVSEKGGTVYYEDLDERDILFELIDDSTTPLKVILDDLENVGLIEVIEDEDVSGLIKVINWEKYQSNKYHSTERVQKHRENKGHDEAITRIINKFNELTGKRYSAKTEETRKLISGRLNDGRTEEEIMAVVNHKHQQWKDDPRMRDYVRPNTIFRPGNFDNYINEIPQNIVKAASDGTLLKVRTMDGAVKNVTQEQYNRAEEGWFEILK